MAWLENDNCRWNGAADRKTAAVISYSFPTGNDLPSISDVGQSVSSVSKMREKGKEFFRKAVAELEDAAGLISGGRQRP
jgi:hypothetical protein